MLAAFALFAVACSADRASSPEAASDTLAATDAMPKADGAAVDANKSTRPRIIAFGDSLTAGYGLPAAQSYPSLLQQKLDADGYNYEVVNAGVSGDTTSGGVRRIAWTLDGNGGKPEIVILELGANDILRGQPVAQLRANLAKMIEESRARGARVLLAGMYSPRNFGDKYGMDVIAAYRSLAEEYRVPLIPFFLEGVALRSELNQADGAHPNAEGTKVVADNVYKALKPMLAKK